ncbi:hypothetical protein BaRGS_00007830 [Batillaria attramentaria]|uniref:Tox-ART-HYD1 domain-containing protein n=1 Tax=Batillaria attramentaria TaxID=370345 RepID=A0ABD0LNC5_9CAEN
MAEGNRVTLYHYTDGQSKHQILQSGHIKQSDGVHGRGERANTKSFSLDTSSSRTVYMAVVKEQTPNPSVWTHQAVGRCTWPW